MQTIWIESTHGFATIVLCWLYTLIVAVAQGAHFVTTVIVSNLRGARCWHIVLHIIKWVAQRRHYSCCRVHAIVRTPSFRVPHCRQERKRKTAWERPFSHVWKKNGEAPHKRSAKCSCWIENESMKSTRSRTRFLSFVPDSRLWKSHQVCAQVRALEISLPEL